MNVCELEGAIRCLPSAPLFCLAPSSHDVDDREHSDIGLGTPHFGSQGWPCDVCRRDESSGLDVLYTQYCEPGSEASVPNLIFVFHVYGGQLTFGPVFIASKQ